MDLTAGTLLGGRIAYQQPAQGYRTGIEPVILAAAVPARPGESVLEAGVGAGAGLLCLHARVPGLHGTGVELDPATAELARLNLAANGAGGWMVATLDITGPDADGLPGWGRFHHAFANPPWHAESGTPSPDPMRSLAKRLPVGALQDWTAALLRAVRPGGTVTVILPGQAALDGVSALQGAECGGLALLPLWPKTGRDARLVVLQGRRGSRAPGRITPGLVLHQPDGQYTEAATAVLRHGHGLDLSGQARSG